MFTVYSFSVISDLEQETNGTISGPSLAVSKNRMHGGKAGLEERQQAVPFQH